MTEPVRVVRAGIISQGRSLILAGVLAGLAGMVDVMAICNLSGLFISFMSGNSTQLAAALGRGHWAGAGAIAELIALFVLGAAAGQMIARLTGARHMTWVLTGVAMLIAGATLGALGFGLIGERVIWVAVGFAGLLAACSPAISQPD